MDKKYLIIIIVVILIIIGGFIFYSTHFSHNTMQIGELTFNIPQNYEITGLNGDGDLTLSNKEDSIYLTCYPSSASIEKIANDYANEKQQNNITVKLSNITINNYQVYKSDSSQGANHYWFKDGNTVYTIFTWKETPNIDKIVNNLISSVRHN